jgi:hypothetical protein
MKIKTNVRAGTYDRCGGYTRCGGSTRCGGGAAAAAATIPASPRHRIDRRQPPGSGRVVAIQAASLGVE